MTVRAKFRCTSDTRTLGYPDPQHKYSFQPAYEPDRPADERYAKSTPQGELWMLVDNSAVSFEVGAYYYLDITPVPEGE